MAVYRGNRLGFASQPAAFAATGSLRLATGSASPRNRPLSRQPARPAAAQFGLGHLRGRTHCRSQWCSTARGARRPPPAARPDGPSPLRAAGDAPLRASERAACREDGRLRAEGEPCAAKTADCEPKASASAAKTAGCEAKPSHLPRRRPFARRSRAICRGDGHLRGRSRAAPASISAGPPAYPPDTSGAPPRSTSTAGARSNSSSSPRPAAPGSPWR